MTPAHQIAEKLTEAQRMKLDLLAGTGGRLTTRAFEDLPNELIDARPEGGLFRQAYISTLGLAVREILKSKGQEHD